MLPLHHTRMVPHLGIEPRKTGLEVPSAFHCVRHGAVYQNRTGVPAMARRCDDHYTNTASPHCPVSDPTAPMWSIARFQGATLDRAEGRNRTGVNGFADRRISTLPLRRGCHGETRTHNIRLNRPVPLPLGSHDNVWAFHPLGGLCRHSLPTAREKPYQFG